LAVGGWRLNYDRRPSGRCALRIELSA